MAAALVSLQPCPLPPHLALKSIVGWQCHRKLSLMAKERTHRENAALAGVVLRVKLLKLLSNRIKDMQFWGLSAFLHFSV